jgi:D-arginine dehydrogenase
MNDKIDTDVIVIGGGIAGASIGYFMARAAQANLKIIILERESHPGVHATGRSAALFSETYGPPQVRTLTRASRPFFANPPAGFVAHDLLTPRGALIVGNAEQAGSLQRFHEAARIHLPDVRLLDARATRMLVPVLEPQFASLGVLEPGAADIDVNALHQGFIRGLKEHGGSLRCNQEVRAIERVAGYWRIETETQVLRAPLLINAAGAWADEIATLAGVARLGLEPRRRSAFIFAPPEAMPVAQWPFVASVADDWYFKPDAGMLLGSPANADPVSAHDVQPEELDIALGIHRIETATSLRIHRPARVWAGLRSFVGDGDIVGAFAPDAEGFFWLAGLGGYGIQTAPALGEACAHLVMGRELPGQLAAAGISSALLQIRQ